MSGAPDPVASDSTVDVVALIRSPPAVWTFFGEPA